MEGDNVSVSTFVLGNKDVDLLGHPCFKRGLFTLGNIGSQAVLGNDGGVSQVVVDIRLLCVELLLIARDKINKAI